MIKNFNEYINEEVQIDELFYDGDKIELRLKNDTSFNKKKFMNGYNSNNPHLQDEEITF